MKNLALLLLFFGPNLAVLAQDCNPCIAVEELHIVSATERLSPEAKLNSGITIMLYVQLDNSTILKIDPDYTRILAFTDDKKVDLLKKGAQIEHMFELDLGKKGAVPTGGIQTEQAVISQDKHAISVPVHTLAKPTNGAQTLLLEGQLGLRTVKDISEETPLKHVDLSPDQPTVVVVNGKKVSLTPVRQQEGDGETFYIFSYPPDQGIIGIHQSASGLKAVEVGENEFFTTSLDKVELIVETANSELVEVPFTLKFGLGF